MARVSTMSHFIDTIKKRDETNQKLERKKNPFTSVMDKKQPFSFYRERRI